MSMVKPKKKVVIRVPISPETGSFLKRSYNAIRETPSVLRAWVEKKQQEDLIREMRRGKGEYEATTPLTPREIWEVREEWAGRTPTPESRDRKFLEKHKRSPWRQI
jgi:hypothetical protein